MKNLLLIVILLIGTFYSCNCEKQESKLRHVVLFDWKEGITQDEIDFVVEEFKALPSKIDVIQDFECGSDVSPEGLQKG